MKSTEIEIGEKKQCNREKTKKKKTVPKSCLLYVPENQMDTYCTNIIKLVFSKVHWIKLITNTHDLMRYLTN